MRKRHLGVIDKDKREIVGTDCIEQLIDGHLLIRDIDHDRWHGDCGYSCLDCRYSCLIVRFTVQEDDSTDATDNATCLVDLRVGQSRQTPADDKRPAVGM